jgi:AhpC/TSA family
MKNLQVLLLLLFCSCRLHGQGIVKLRTTIKNRPSDSVTLRYTPLNVGDSLVILESAIGPDGSCSFSFVINDTFTILDLEIGDNSVEIPVFPGADLTLEADAKRFHATIHYTGSGSEIANFAARYNQQFGNLNDYHGIVSDIFKAEPLTFEQARKKTQQKQLSFVTKNKNGLPPAFADYWEAGINYSCYEYLLMYPHMHQIVKDGKNNVAEIPAGYFATVKNVPEVFEDRYLCLPGYLIYVSMVCYAKVRVENKKNPGAIPIPVVGAAADKHAISKMPYKTLEYYFSLALIGGYKGHTIAEYAIKYKDFVGRFPASRYLPAIERKLAIKRKFAVGTHAPDFAITTANGTKLKLSDLKGKVVFLDFCGTQSLEAERERVRTKELQSHFQGKPVELVYILVEDEESDEQNVKDWIDGLHTLTTSNSLLTKIYDVDFPPRYFLIDKNGNFGSENAPSPSQKTELITAIEHLLTR